MGGSTDAVDFVANGNGDGDGDDYDDDNSDNTGSALDNSLDEMRHRIEQARQSALAEANAFDALVKGNVSLSEGVSRTGSIKR